MSQLQQFVIQITEQTYLFLLREISLFLFFCFLFCIEMKPEIKFLNIFKEGEKRRRNLTKIRWSVSVWFLIQVLAHLSNPSFDDILLRSVISWHRPLCHFAPHWSLGSSQGQGLFLVCSQLKWPSVPLLLLFFLSIILYMVCFVLTLCCWCLVLQGSGGSRLTTSVSISRRMPRMTLSSVLSSGSPRWAGYAISSF